MSDEAVVEQPDTPVEDPSVVGNESVVTGPDPDAAQPESVEEAPNFEQRFAELESQYEADRKKYENAQQLIARQGTELGQLRSFQNQMQQQQPKDSAKYLEEFAENPQKVIEEEISRREMERTNSASQQELAALQLKQQVLNYVPEFDNHLDSIKEWYKDKGASESFTDNLGNTIYSNVDLAVALADVAQYKAKVAELENNIKDGRAGAEQKIDQMQAAAKRGRTVGAKSGGAITGTRDMSSTDITSLSDAELKAKLAELSR